jgi:hypothetical protein
MRCVAAPGNVESMNAQVATRVERRPTVRAADYYWLARCEGYNVVSSDGHLGTVFGVRFDPETAALVGLRVRAGLLRRHLLIIPIDDVIGIEPRRHLVYVRDGNTMIDTGAKA